MDYSPRGAATPITWHSSCGAAWRSLALPSQCHCHGGDAVGPTAVTVTAPTAFGSDSDQWLPCRQSDSGSSPAGTLAVLCPLTMWVLLQHVTGIDLTERLSLQARPVDYAAYQRARGAALDLALPPS